MGVQIFITVTNVFVGVRKAIAIFVCMMVIMMILIMFHDRCINLRSSKKKGEMSVWGEVDEILEMCTLGNKMFFNLVSGK